MDTLHIITLAILQGLTEFLPISSSAHLILVPYLFGWTDQGLAFDVAVHVGTLIAVITYFRRHLKQLISDCYIAHCRHQTTPSTNLAGCIILASVPAILVGLFLSDIIAAYLRAPIIIALANIGFALALWWSDSIHQPQRNEYTLTYRHALLIGLAQTCAFIPGASRSGTTIMAGLLMGLDRQAAARFSFLLSIPLIVAAGSLLTMQLILQSAPVDWFALCLGTVISAISAYLCIHYFLKLLDRIGMLPFVIYRLLLGGFLLWVLVPIH